MVINGWEIGGGSIRINDIEIQKVFEALDISESLAREKFIFDKSIKFRPSHGGIAFGLDQS